MAITSVITSVVIAPLGIVFGHIALHQIKHSRERGRGLAIAGLAIGYSLTAIAIIASVSLTILISSAVTSISDDGPNLDLRGTWTAQATSTDKRDVQLQITQAKPLRGDIMLTLPEQAINCTATWKEANRTFSSIVVEAKVTNGPCTDNEWSLTVVGNTMTATQTWSQAGADTPDLVLRRS